MANRRKPKSKQTGDRITLNPAVLAGKPTIRGLRISVEQILRALANGVTTEALLDDYPVLEAEDIQACLEYAADLVEADKVYAVSAHEDSR
jgi:uncharacterized protein (DUF433 family)